MVRIVVILENNHRHTHEERERERRQLTKIELNVIDCNLNSDRLIWLVNLFVRVLIRLRLLHAADASEQQQLLS